MFNIIKKLFKSDNDNNLDKIQKIVGQINKKEEWATSLSDNEIKNKKIEFQEKISNGLTLDSVLVDAFAITRVAAQRTLGQRHYDVQLVGGIVLNEGNIAEMKTGEGKSLVATLPVYLNALVSKVHVVTVNDYLAQLHVVELGQIYAALGMTIGVVNTNGKSYVYDPGHKELDHQRDTQGYYKIVHEFLRETTKLEAYGSNIVYGVNNEFAFDYLRDNMVLTKEEKMQGDYGFAIIDEVDSILIDEARQPLIISGAHDIPVSSYITYTNIAKQMQLDSDYTVDEKQISISINSSGIEKIEKALGVDNLYIDGGQKTIHYIENALKAKSLYKRDKHYVVRNSEAVIVDEFTGRLQPGKQWSYGLHQAIEAKEGLNIHKETKTLASTTFQNYFKKYKKLSGMTGTAYSSLEEFRKVYNLDVIKIPTNKPSLRVDDLDSIFIDRESKLVAIVKHVKQLYEKKQPVLIGTVSIEHNEKLSNLLKKAGVKHNILNAKNHEREGEIIANAGKESAVTVATNLAGRGVDIKLGGSNATKQEYEQVKKNGGLFVLGIERHEARRIDDQLRGRSARQGDLGGTKFYISLEDDLMRIFGSANLRSMLDKFNFPREQEIKNKFISNGLENAQKRVEGHNFDARRMALSYDNVLSKQRDLIYSIRDKILFSTEKDIENIYKEFLFLTTLKIGPKTISIEHSQLLLKSIDYTWIEHLELMEYAKQSAGLRQNTIQEYKKEGRRIFSLFYNRAIEIFTNQYEKETNKTK